MVLDSFDKSCGLTFWIQKMQKSSISVVKHSSDCWQSSKCSLTSKKLNSLLDKKNRKLRRFWQTLKKSKQTKILSTEGTSAPHRGPTRTENVFRSAGKCKSAPRAFFQTVCACCPVCITSFGIKKGMGRKSILEKNFKFLVYLWTLLLA